MLEQGKFITGVQNFGSSKNQRRWHKHDPGTHALTQLSQGMSETSKNQMSYLQKPSYCGVFGIAEFCISSIILY
jgi:hypothetical protein